MSHYSFSSHLGIIIICSFKKAAKVFHDLRTVVDPGEEEEAMGNCKSTLGAAIGSSRNSKGGGGKEVVVVQSSSRVNNSAPPAFDEQISALPSLELQSLTSSSRPPSVVATNNTGLITDTDSFENTAFSSPTGKESKHGNNNFTVDDFFSSSNVGDNSTISYVSGGRGGGDRNNDLPLLNPKATGAADDAATCKNDEVKQQPSTISVKSIKVVEQGKQFVNETNLPTEFKGLSERERLSYISSPSSCSDPSGSSSSDSDSSESSDDSDSSESSEDGDSSESSTTSDDDSSESDSSSSESTSSSNDDESSGSDETEDMNEEGQKAERHIDDAAAVKPKRAHEREEGGCIPGEIEEGPNNSSSPWASGQNQIILASEQSLTVWKLDPAGLEERNIRAIVKAESPKNETMNINNSGKKRNDRITS